MTQFLLAEQPRSGSGSAQLTNDGKSPGGATLGGRKVRHPPADCSRSLAQSPAAIGSLSGLLPGGSPRCVLFTTAPPEAQKVSQHGDHWLPSMPEQPAPLAAVSIPSCPLSGCAPWLPLRRLAAPQPAPLSGPVPSQPQAASQAPAASTQRGSGEWICGARLNSRWLERGRDNSGHIRRH